MHVWGFQSHGVMFGHDKRQYGSLTLLELQSRFGDKPVKFGVICPQNGTAVLKGLS